MVVEAGSELASAEPSRIEKNGTAHSSITHVATAANSAGRRASQSVQRRHSGRLVVAWRALLRAIARRSPRRSTRPPNSDSSAGVSVSAPITVKATMIAAANATPYRKRDAEQHHAEHRHADDRAGEHHGAARGVERLHDRLLALEPAQHALSVAGDDEQRVVDPDPEPDQHRELARERGHPDHVREQADERDAGPEREAGGEQRQQHRRQRPEHEQQHDAGGGEPQWQAGRRTRGVAVLGHLAVRRERHAVARGGLDHRVVAALLAAGDRGGGDVEGDRRERDLTGLRNLRGPG